MGKLYVNVSVVLKAVNDLYVNVNLGPVFCRSASIKDEMYVTRLLGGLTNLWESGLPAVPEGFMAIVLPIAASYLDSGYIKNCACGRTQTPDSTKGSRGSPLMCRCVLFFYY